MNAHDKTEVPSRVAESRAKSFTRRAASVIPDLIAQVFDVTRRRRFQKMFARASN